MATNSPATSLGVALTGNENCSKCWTPIDEDNATFYHCSRCPEFHLCAACFVTVKHKHFMRKSGPQFLTTDDSEDMEIMEDMEGTAVKKVASKVEPMSESIENCLLLLNHTQNCGKKNCPSAACGRMRKVIIHSQNCRRKEGQTEPCPICKQLVALISYHARTCDYDRCSVPYCNRIKEKMGQQRIAQASMSSISNLFSTNASPISQQ